MELKVCTGCHNSYRDTCVAVGTTVRSDNACRLVRERTAGDDGESCACRS
jgi:hypothetical protein